jgi:hypothetical protein
MTSPEVPPPIPPVWAPAVQPKSYLNKMKNGVADMKKGIQDIRKGEGYLGEKIQSVSRKVANKIDQTTTILDTFAVQAAKIEKVPSFYKIVFLIFFYIFFYKIFYDIGLFFGLNELELIIYMTWFGMILLFASFIKSTRSRLK